MVNGRSRFITSKVEADMSIFCQSKVCYKQLYDQIALLGSPLLDPTEVRKHFITIHNHSCGILQIILTATLPASLPVLLPLH